MNDDQDHAQHDPSVNDVLAQQMGTEYAEVESQDKEALQKDLSDQVVEQSSDKQTKIPSEGVVDDRNTSDGQLIGY